MIHVGDCLNILPTLDAASVDAIVSDPPYGLGFMGKAWDHAVPGIPFWVEMLRVAKPGAFLVAFGGTRTFHRMACAIEDAVAVSGYRCDLYDAAYGDWTRIEKQAFADGARERVEVLWLNRAAAIAQTQQQLLIA